MKRILITGAGGSPSTNFVRSLRDAPEPYYLIGVDCNAYYLQRAETDERHLVPEADAPEYIPILKNVIAETGAEFIYSQPDPEILQISQHRQELGIKTFLPAHATIDLCQDKFRSFRAWKEAGLPVPETLMIESRADLERAFHQFGSPIWLRAVISPGGGKGSFPAPSMPAAAAWLDFCSGWGRFTAAECLEQASITWTSVWNQGELVVAQGRKRLYWELGNRSPSGVTGITGAGVTVSDPVVDDLALRTVQAVDTCPHGIFAVDLTYDKAGVPNPTEINIGRFFTTHLFFTRAGLNLPYLVIKLAFGEPLPALPTRMNPLKPNLAWIRGVDFLPILTDLNRIQESVQQLERRKERVPVS